MDIPKMKTNYGKGPTTGNASARSGKRETFQEGKLERSGLAKSINAAYAARTKPPVVDPRLESVEGDVKPKRFKK